MSSGVEGVEELAKYEEVYEYVGYLGESRVSVKIHFKEGVLWDIVLDVVLYEKRTDAYVSCMGYSDLVDACFALALDATEKLLREVVLHSELHETYTRYGEEEK
ncbi:MAG: hypothetical protein LM564_02005 [Desulfurococcaceae archaeon]|nr:hypothetical protein [Desulfurococcaceae archaeon]